MCDSHNDECDGGDDDSDVMMSVVTVMIVIPPLSTLEAISACPNHWCVAADLLLTCRSSWGIALWFVVSQTPPQHPKQWANEEQTYHRDSTGVVSLRPSGGNQ